MTGPQQQGREIVVDPALARVLARFGFDGSSVESIESLTSRATQQSMLIRARGARWVLKRHTSARALERLELSHRLEIRLADGGFPVAPIQRTESGQTLVHDGPARYSLHAWVHGHQMAIADRAAIIEQHPDFPAALGSTLGTLHRISGGLELTGVSPVVGIDRLLASPRYALRSLRRPRLPLLSRWHSLRLKRDKSDFDRWIIGALPLVADRAASLAVRSVTTEFIPTESGVIHNDINWENLIFDDEFHVAALLDFDNATLSPWVMEVGAATVVLVGAHADRTEEFLSAYEEVRQVRLDREIVKLAMTLKCVQSILNSINLHLSGDTTHTPLLASWSTHLYESLVELDAG